MNTVELIRKKRDGAPLTADEIRAFVRGYTAGEVADYQAAALLMAIFIRGLSADELSALTDAMLHSGDVLDLSDIAGPKVDKHSTGGVGDKVSLHLAPAVAAAGVNVPMISGRGLGHTGGTLDKLESITGFRVDLSVERFRAVLTDCRMSLIGQTDRLAPADKKLYALRDVTGTVESVPLISASIMSKKLAEGIDGLVLDVKVGSGAFMKSLDDARVLAETLVGIGRRAGKKCSAFLTNMDQPLGRWVGNAVEVWESLEVLRGGGPDDLVELTLALGGEMLRLGGAVTSYEAGREKISRTLKDGSALRAFERCVQLQGGDLSSIKATEHTRGTPVIAGAGFVTAIHAEKIGLAGVALGAGRTRKEDAIDPLAWIYLNKKIGEPVAANEPVAFFDASKPTAAQLADVGERIKAAYTIASAPPKSAPLIWETIR